jgi:uncharacterized protein YecE (DUF72 family)
MESSQTRPAEIHVGTSGFSYKDWVGPVYPVQLPAENHLSYYFQLFQSIEINASFYTFPAQSVFEGFLRKSPDKASFILKAHQDITHTRRDPESLIEKTMLCAGPLLDSPKFAGILLQFPYSFHNETSSRHYLVRLSKSALNQYPLFLELRHAGWNREMVYDFIGGLGFHYVNVDQPPLKGLLPPQALVFGDKAYIRFHGRNSAQWWVGRNEQRYDYEYSNEELRGWLTAINQILNRTYKLYIFFNNHPNGQAVRNAQAMLHILEKEFPQANLF